MAKRLQRNLEILKILKNCKSRKDQNCILKLVNKDLIQCLCDCAHNILQGNIKLSKQKKISLKKHSSALRDLAEKKGGIEKKRKFLIQKGGFLPALLGPIISIASGLISQLVAK